MPKTEVKVIKYKGNRAAQKGIEKMLKQGWTLQDQASRKAVFSLAVGVFTRKQIHTITFVREVETRRDKREARKAMQEQAAVREIAAAESEEESEAE